MFNSISKFLDKFSNRMEKVDQPDKLSKYDIKLKELERVNLALTSLGGRISNEVRKLSESASNLHKDLLSEDLNHMRESQAHKDLLVYSLTLSKLELNNETITSENLSKIITLYKKLDGADSILTEINVKETSPYFLGMYKMHEAVENLKRMKGLMFDLFVEINCNITHEGLPHSVRSNASIHEYIEHVYVKISELEYEDA